MASSKITRLTRDDVIEGLRDIVLRLQKDGTAVGVYIVGGAALALRYDADRQTTRDVDAMIHPRSATLRHAADIASARGWEPDWLNTSADVFIPVSRDVGWQPLFDDGVVSVSVASADVFW